MNSLSGLLICVVGATIFISVAFVVASIRIVQEDKRLSVYRLGRFIGDKGPGVVVLIPLIDRAILKELNAIEKISSDKLLYKLGEATTMVHTNGKILIMGEEWDAISQSPISAGERVRVVKVVLQVEKE